MKHLLRRRRREEAAESEDDLGAQRRSRPIAEDAEDNAEEDDRPLSRQRSMLGHPFGGRLSGGIRHWNPDLYRWLSDRMGTRGKASLLLSLLILQALTFVLYDTSTPGWVRGINNWSVLVVGHAVSLLIALVVSLVLDGYWAVPKIFSWHAFWRLLGVSCLFSAATWFQQQAYKQDVAHAATVLLGYTYMPLAAFLSFLVFSRRYGILEWLSMGMMTLAACTFMMLRERYVEGGTDAAVQWIQKHFTPVGVTLILCSVATSVAASILAESIYKEKDRRLKSKWALGHDRFYIMKIHIEFTALSLAIIFWTMPRGLGQVVGIQSFTTWFGPWSAVEALQVISYVALSWVAGLVTQQMNTVVKAIVQTIANVSAVIVSDTLGSRYRFDLRAAPELMLAIIILMSAIIFQTGRIIIHRLRDQWESTPKDTLVDVRSEDPDPDDVRNGPHGLFSTASEIEGQPSRAASGRLAAPPVPLSLYQQFSTYSCIILYIFVDISRTLLNQHALQNSPSNPSTMPLLQFVITVLMLCCYALWKDGWKGLAESWRCSRILESLPAASLFAFGQCLTSFSFALGISPALQNILGKIYTPIAAFGGRCILDRYYSWLEYFAIVILTLASLSFGYLQESTVGGGLQWGGRGAAITCALGSAVFAAFGSLTTEKILQAKKGEGKEEPFRVQKMRLDIGSTLTTLLVLPILSTISSRAKDNIWVSRPWGSGHPECSHCETKLAGGFPHWPTDALEQSCSSDHCFGDCACLPSLIVGWDNKIMILALAMNLGYGWLVGVVTKRFSTMHRAIADAFSTLLLYWVGEPLFSAQPYLVSVQDICLDMVSFIVPLSTVTFMVATSQMKEVMLAAHPVGVSREQTDSESGNSSEDSEEESEGSSSS